ncbi:hypothetical protein BRC83_08990 [Halobacteriales archaeon QS_1_68_17]|nr:MAG: hypothetical protein BRC83_08990 [Halobacteriales archaeon QS_1_68_17]
MYGNAPFADRSVGAVELSTEQRRRLRQDLVSVAARTRELLPNDFVVGSELSEGTEGPRARIAVQPPVGSIVSADYAPDADAETTITPDEREDLALGLAASAALQVKRSMDDVTQTAR